MQATCWSVGPVKLQESGAFWPGNHFEGMKGWTGSGVGTNWMDLRNGKPLSVFWKKGRGRKASPGRPGD